MFSNKIKRLLKDYIIQVWYEIWFEFIGYFWYKKTLNFVTVEFLPDLLKTSSLNGIKKLKI